jgi:type VII secretion-associated serine protease mycosin
MCGTAVTASPAAHAAEEKDCQKGETAYLRQRGLSNALPMISAPQSWKLATGKGQTVAVVDSGVSAGNQHLGDAVLPGTSLVPGDVDGRTDELGHGTSVAGVIAGRKIPQSVLQGQAYDAKLLPVRVYDYPETPDQSAQPPRQPLSPEGVAAGIRWAADNGADVINVSLSSGPAAPGLDKEREAVKYAQRKGALIVASSGDSAVGKVTMERYPASFPGVIGVAAANTTGNVDDYSVHNKGVDVLAPGQRIMVTFFDNGDCLGGQTPQSSYAAAFVSGLAAQLKEKFPDESNAMIAWRITATAKRARPSARDDQSGWGLIQPYAALTVVPDASRPGPRLPGARSVATAKTATGLRMVSETRDPMAEVRNQIVWWALGGVALTAVALLLRPLVRRRSRS